MARPTVRAQRRPLTLLLGGLVVLAGMWLAGGLAAAAGWPLWARWLAAALVWPIAPLVPLILVSPRLGLQRVAVVLTLLGVGACALWWRPGLVAAVTTHAVWMRGASEGDRPAIESVPPPRPVAPLPGPGERPPPDAAITPPTAPDPGLPDLPAPLPVVPDAPAATRSRCFREHVESAHSDRAYTTTLVDLDGDQILDAVAIESGDSSAIRVWKGDRAGRFQAASTLPYADGGLHFAVLDIDRDGKLDLATSDYKSPTITLWIGAGDGSFTRGASHGTYRSPLGIVAADLDADGFSDLVVDHYFHVEVMRGGKGGKLRTAPWLRLEKEAADPSTLLTPEGIAAADLTGDGLLDLVIPKGDVTSIEVWAGRGRGSFRRTAVVPSCYAPADARVGDVVEDGALDVVVDCGKGHAELYAGDGKGGLTSRGQVGGGDALNAGPLADLDGDGHLDLVAATLPGGLDMRSFGTTSGVLTVYAGDGKGGFAELDRLALDGYQHRIVAVVDIDGDEHLDVVHECFGQSPGGHLGVAFGTGCAAQR